MTATLRDLIALLGGEGDAGERPIVDVELDSRRVGPDALFVALASSREERARHVADAVARGAAAVLATDPVGEQALRRTDGSLAALWTHRDARRIAGLAAATVHGDPSRSMFVAAVTGTNGKTTTAHLIGQLLDHVGRRCAVLGTAGNRLAGGAIEPATHTTPDGPGLQRLLARHRDLGGDAAALEVSSHALDQQRTSGLEVDVAVFTNLSRDHLDYHGTLERYAQAKERLFGSLGRGGVAVINADDPHGERMANAARSAGARVVKFSTRSRVDLWAGDIAIDPAGTQLFFDGMGISRTRVRLPLSGRFNVENALAACAAVLLSGASPSQVVAGLASVFPAPGRLERIASERDDALVFVDYAHTEDALRKALSTLREMLDSRPAKEDKSARRLICVFGCGGDRDPGKRAPMGRAVNEIADLAVVTSDNPRGEDASVIIDAILSGMQPARARIEVESDRRRAIELAVSQAEAGDVVLIAGKGHETTQTVGKRVLPFDDRRVAAEALAERAAGRSRKTLSPHPPTLPSKSR